MYIIYKGYNFPISITSNVQLDLAQSRLFNAATLSSVPLEELAHFPYGTQTADTWEYQVVVDQDVTAGMYKGVYSLELRTTNGYMAEFINNFAKVVDTAYVNVEQESSES